MMAELFPSLCQTLSYRTAYSKSKITANIMDKIGCAEKSLRISQTAFIKVGNLSANPMLSMMSAVILILSMLVCS
jgi:hypothetical protein